MASQLTGSPEETRAALVRYVEAKCGAAAVADLLPHLDTAAIAQSLRVSPEATRVALKDRVRLAGAGFEGKVFTQDGRVWPQARDRMRDPEAIVARMAEDIARAARAEHDGVVEAHHLQALGWTEAQLAAHGQEAARRAAEAMAMGRAA